MPAAIEVSEFLRALGFPGSDGLIIVTVALILLEILRSRAPAQSWAGAIFFVSVPVIYAFASQRFENLNIAISILAFWAVLQRHSLAGVFYSGQRATWFLMLVAASYFLPFGDPIYQGSDFRSLFDSGNAFVYYLLINGCALAFIAGSAVVSASVALPLVMIQTKSAVVLLASNRRSMFLAILMIYPLYLFIVSLERIAWFLQQYGVVYALGSGRVERLGAHFSSVFDFHRLLIGTPYPTTYQNFEVEFIDFTFEFGALFTALFFSATVLLIRGACSRHFGKLTLLFLLLNISGHFWNNPVLVITFAATVRYVGHYRDESLS